jgi:SAM-dependent methyltransferase
MTTMNADLLARLRAGLARRLPPGLRRAAAGLLLDLRSLPVRLRDPARRGDPWQTLHNVSAGGYVGFDVSHAAIVGCRRRFARQRPDFDFVHADVRNADYSPRGALAETGYRFPCADGSIDLAFATSVFTHMRIEPVRHYLAEAARVLRPGGRFAFTAYLIDDDVRGRLAAGGTLMVFAPWRDGSWVLDPAHPERAIAHETTFVSAAVAAAGLVPDSPPLAGAWRPPAAYHGWQDLMVVRKP